jgi:SAM-dependent methyltransferase
MEPHELSRMFAVEERYWWYRALRRRILAALLRAGAFPAAGPPPAFLDAGCGTGMLLATLGPRVRALGVDNSALALSLARRRGVGPLVRASVEALPLRPASQAIVVSADVLYHRDVHDDVGALRELARCLRPGGLLALNLPAFGALRSVHDDAVHTARRYTAPEVRAKLVQAGLVPLEVRYWNWLLLPPIACVRFARRRPRPSWELAGERDARRAEPGPHSDLVPLPRWLDGLLHGLLRLEERLELFPPPAGTSVLAVARKADA